MLGTRTVAPADCDFGARLCPLDQPPRRVTGRRLVETTQPRSIGSGSASFGHRTSGSFGFGPSVFGLGAMGERICKKVLRCAQPQPLRLFPAAPLRGMRWEKSRDRLLQRLGAARQQAGRAAAFVRVQLPAADPPISRATFRCIVDQDKLADAELYDGHCLLRSNLPQDAPAWLWRLFMLLVEIEGVFRTFQHDLHVRPNYHWLAARVEAHICVSFLAYCRWVTLKQKLRVLPPGLTPRQALDQLAGVQMLDVELPTTDGRLLTLSRYTQPEPAVRLLLQQLKFPLREQPPSRWSAAQQLELPAGQCREDLSGAAPKN